MRDHQFVDGRFITPPWCINVIVSGHTFPKSSETFIPSAKWGSTNITFPPLISVEDSVYRTALVANDGDTPIHFLFNNESDIFTCKPALSLLQPQNYQIFLFRVSPLNTGTVKTKIKCMLNASEKHLQEFELMSSVESPQISLSPNDIVYFQPTCIGSMSDQTTVVTNTFRLPLT